MVKRKPRRRSLMRPGTIGILLWLMAAPAIAHAHGGMAGPDEIGPPLLTSVALGFICYWLVILWPSSRRKDDAPTSSSRPSGKGRRARRLRALNAGQGSQHSLRLKKAAGRKGA